MKPLISCIMPMFDRHDFAKLAIENFLAQDYPNKELVILDDGKVPFYPSNALVPDNVHYFYSGPVRKGIAFKRNKLCAMSRGELIAIWDDDDYNGPKRLSHQAALFSTSIAFSGYHTVLFFDQLRTKAYSYFGTRYYATGTSFMFRKALWEDNKFNEILITGSDVDFLIRVNKIRPYLCKIVHGSDNIIARAHKANTSFKSFDNSSFKEVSLDALPIGFLKQVGLDSRCVLTN